MKKIDSIISEKIKKIESALSKIFKYSGNRIIRNSNLSPKEDEIANGIVIKFIEMYNKISESNLENNEGLYKKYHKAFENWLLDIEKSIGNNVNYDLIIDRVASLLKERDSGAYELFKEFSSTPAEPAETKQISNSLVSDSGIDLGDTDLLSDNLFDNSTFSEKSRVFLRKIFANEEKMYDYLLRKSKSLDNTKYQNYTEIKKKEKEYLNTNGFTDKEIYDLITAIFSYACGKNTLGIHYEKMQTLLIPDGKFKNYTGVPSAALTSDGNFKFSGEDKIKDQLIRFLKSDSRQSTNILQSPSKETNNLITYSVLESFIEQRNNINNLNREVKSLSDSIRNFINEDSIRIKYVDMIYSSFSDENYKMVYNYAKYFLITVIEVLKNKDSLAKVNKDSILLKIVNITNKEIELFSSFFADFFYKKYTSAVTLLVIKYVVYSIIKYIVYSSYKFFEKLDKLLMDNLNIDLDKNNIQKFTYDRCQKIVSALSPAENFKNLIKTIKQSNNQFSIDIFINKYVDVVNNSLVLYFQNFFEIIKSFNFNLPDNATKLFTGYSLGRNIQDDKSKSVDYNSNLISFIIEYKVKSFADNLKNIEELGKISSNQSSPVNQSSPAKNQAGEQVQVNNQQQGNQPQNKKSNKNNIRNNYDRIIDISNFDEYVSKVYTDIYNGFLRAASFVEGEFVVDDVLSNIVDPNKYPILFKNSRNLILRELFAYDVDEDTVDDKEKEELSSYIQEAAEDIVDETSDKFIGLIESLTKEIIDNDYLTPDSVESLKTNIEHYVDDEAKKNEEIEKKSAAIIKNVFSNLINNDISVDDFVEALHDIEFSVNLSKVLKSEFESQGIKIAAPVVEISPEGIIEIKYEKKDDDEFDNTEEDNTETDISVYDNEYGETEQEEDEDLFNEKGEGTAEELGEGISELDNEDNIEDVNSEDSTEDNTSGGNKDSDNEDSGEEDLGDDFFDVVSGTDDLDTDNPGSNVDTNSGTDNESQESIGNETMDNETMDNETKDNETMNTSDSSQEGYTLLDAARNRKWD